MVKHSLSVICPKKYYQLATLPECRKCKFFEGVKENEILCQYQPPERGKIHRKNKLNELTGSEWLFFTKSVLRTEYPREFRHDLRQEVGASKPPRLMELLIRFFTKSKETLLDPFAGTGATLIGASLCDRKAIGIEINPKWINVYKKVCKDENIEEQESILGECLEVMKKFVEEKKKFQAIITDPPYSPGLKKTLTLGDYPEWRRRWTRFTKFSSNPRDFRRTKNFEEYYDKMEKALGLMFELLENDRYAIVMIRDSYQNGKYIPTSFYVAQRAEKKGFYFKGVKIWYQTGAPIRPYGYPFSYVPNIIHHNILVFKKEIH